MEGTIFVQYGTVKLLFLLSQAAATLLSQPADKIKQECFEMYLHTVRVLHYLAKCGSTVATTLAYSVRHKGSVD